MKYKPRFDHKAALSMLEEKDERGIQNAPLVNVDYTKPNQVLGCELISAMFNMWKAIEEKNKLLEVELAKLRGEERNRETMAKVQLLEMLDAARKYSTATN
jgi:hypothetical protein